MYFRINISNYYYIRKGFWFLTNLDMVFSEMYTRFVIWTNGIKILWISYSYYLIEQIIGAAREIV
jgi:hypothetical protein